MRVDVELGVVDTRTERVTAGVGARARQLQAGLPAAFVFPGLTALLVAVLPRAAVVGVWTLYGVAVGIGVFGGLLDLPDAVRYASPFADVPTVPITDWTGFLVLLAVDLLLPALAIAAYRRRDLLVV